MGRLVRIRGQNCTIQNGAPNMAAKVSIFCKSNSILPTGIFWGAESDSEVKIAKFKMAAKITIFCKSNSILPTARKIFFLNISKKSILLDPTTH